MDLIMMLSVFCGILVLFCIALLMALLKSSNRIIEINKQLLIVVAGREPKPESALRALVASAKPPQGKLRGIADDKKKKDDKPKNTNYMMEIGVNNGL